MRAISIHLSIKKPLFLRHYDRETGASPGKGAYYARILEESGIFPGAGQQVFQQFRDDEQARPAVFIGAAGIVRRSEGADAGPLF